MADKATLCSLRDREVISSCDGKRLGFVCDIEIDTCTGRVCALILPGDIRMPFFVRGADICVPWECVERIGKDVILVNSGGIFPIERPRMFCKKK